MTARYPCCTWIAISTARRRQFFDHLAPWIVNGTVIVFDEYFNYPGWREHEYKAFREFLRAFEATYEYLSFVDSNQQVGVRITGAANVKPFVTAKRSVIRDEFLGALIERSTFSFTRTDGTVLGEGVQLLPDGSTIRFLASKF